MVVEQKMQIIRDGKFITVIILYMLRRTQSHLCSPSKVIEGLALRCAYVCRWCACSFFVGIHMLSTNICTPIDAIDEDPLPSAVAIDEDPLTSAVAIDEDPLTSAVAIDEDPLPSAVAIDEDPLPSAVAIDEDPLTSAVTIDEDPLPSAVAIDEDPLTSADCSTRYGYLYIEPIVLTNPLKLL